MINLIKKTIGTKTISLSFIALFASVFIGNEVYAMLHKQATEEWLLDDTMTSPNPLNPNHYVLYSGSLASDCLLQEEICGIKAPVGPDGKPIIDEDLEERIRTQDDT